MISIKDVAKRTMNIPEIIKGRMRIKTDEVLENFPYGITIDGFEMSTSIDGKEQALITFSENPKLYYSGTSMMTKIMKSWLMACDNDEKKANDELKAEGGLKVKLKKETTSNGNTFINIELL